MSSPAIAWTPELVDQTLAKIMQRASTDTQFRSLAIGNSKAAIAKVSDVPLPESFTVRFVDGSGANLTVV